jgi:hypothetical protein
LVVCSEPCVETIVQPLLTFHQSLAWSCPFGATDKCGVQHYVHSLSPFEDVREEGVDEGRLAKGVDWGVRWLTLYGGI